MTISWTVSNIPAQSAVLTLQISFADGYTPDIATPGTYDAASHTLSIPVTASASSAGGQFVLNVQNPADNAVFPASLVVEPVETLATTSLSLPKHEKFNAKKSGSSFTAQKGKVKVSFDAGTLPEDAVVNIGAPAGDAVPAYSLSGSPFEIDAQGAQSKQDLRQFSDEVSIDVDYSDLDLRGASDVDLYLYYYDPATQEWVALPSRADPGTKTLHATSTHFTVFDIGINNFQASHLPTVDAFQVSSFTGAGTYSMPIEVPAGPGGLQPNLSLGYNSQVIDQSTTQAQSSWVGMGWSLEMGSIELNTNGTTTTASDDTYMLNVAGISTAIVFSDNDGFYHAADESFMKFNYDKTADAWTVWDKSGNIYFFEKAIQMIYYGAGTDSNNCGPVSMPYQWRLTRVRNIFGRELTYTYAIESKPMNRSEWRKK